MAKIDITSLEWCDMLFANKNKAYGAYMMRQTSAKRHNKALLLLIVIAAFAFALPTLIQMAKPKHSDDMTQVTAISAIKHAEVKQKKFERPPEEKEPEQQVKSSMKFVAPVIKKDNEVKEEDEMKSQQQLTQSNVAISIADVKGNNENGKDIADLKKVVTQEAPKEEEDTKVFDMVEQMPTFPGGQGELLSWIGSHLKYPTIAAENGIEGRVIVQFVVGKDGRVRDATIMRSLNPACDKEAERVVLAMPKWIPGKQNGKEVSVKYTLPITFKLQ